MTETPKKIEQPKKGGVLAALPLVGFVLLAGLFLYMFQMREGRDASVLPSPLIGRPAPAFTLEALPGSGKPGLSDADLRQGHTTVVNLFASWCGPCRVEHPSLRLLLEDPMLKINDVRLVGIAYKDEPANALKFLSTEGDPYAAIGMDLKGRAAIDWGLTGVPETFVVRGDGTIAYKYTGPMTEQALREKVLPEIEKTLR
ncbi:cytochrome c biogenesis protein CcmG, thiol:disulfide interchange protein DsbE [Rhodoblastus acidophilus]|uniref:Cytochrome c biogenesis protein CcmG, thiol:disulfide interchange protein DsbE n=1 Tax=Rhodoblastus acidophilus TaxID=1074 RepID=A0A212RL89_RHOAC|nr:DsbE family thiol:disulfide interchange protein [Rhodoblastus acidophilus]SNB73219.1 cytochrome c biogenesis protein CcmG, thiol:disulfide interchange protein DsbE [Rhodoblastus acidophilus]